MKTIIPFSHCLTQVVFISILFEEVFRFVEVKSEGQKDFNIGPLSKQGLVNGLGSLEIAHTDRIDAGSVADGV